MDYDLILKEIEYTNRQQGEGGFSCHHGDLNRENNLAAVKKLEKRYGGEIGIYEIDFISFHDELYSSHDYTTEAIREGNKLSAWVEYIIVEKRKILWLDIKENYWFYFNCGFERFSVPTLMKCLKSAKNYCLKKHSLDITPFIWLGCQESSVHERIVQENRGKWQMILDLPRVNTYIVRKITLGLFGDWYLDRLWTDYQESHNHDRYKIITLDKLFFQSTREMLLFIKTLRLPSDVTIIVNSFPRNVPPLTLENHHIITQYDYYSSD